MLTAEQIIDEALHKAFAADAGPVVVGKPCYVGHNPVYNAAWLTLWHVDRYLAGELENFRNIEGRPSFKLQFPNLKDATRKF